MAEDINDDLLEKGVIMVSDISNQYSLPVEFIYQVGFLNFQKKIFTQF
jgi:hypothetical protein